MTRAGATTDIREDPDYLSRQLITCIGNKRALLGPIADALDWIKGRLGRRRLRCLDVFSGSGVVSRLMKSYAAHLISNDWEDYAAVIGRCFLANRSAAPLTALAGMVRELNAQVAGAPFPPGFIEELYAPRDETRITRADRVFYTRNNAQRLDNYRRLIAQLPPAVHDFLLGPLLSEASVHANTAGVFKGFYKNRRTGIGQFGGSGADALSRIVGPITLAVPVLSRFECEVEVWQADANAAARRARGLDVAYVDPPYNQHPYGSNYFMLNLLVHYRKPDRVSRVSGIPADWRRSGYNVRSESFRLFEDLIAQLDAPFLLVSYNNEGFIRPAEMRALLSAEGDVQTVELRYNAFRGSRNFNHRPRHTTEHLFIVERRSRPKTRRRPGRIGPGAGQAASINPVPMTER